MAVFEQYTPGLGSVGNYQVAGTPWVTGSVLPVSGNLDGLNTSTHRLRFPYVTKEITIANMGTGEIAVTFVNDLGSIGSATGGHGFTVPPSGTAPGSPLSRVTFDVKTKEIYISNKHSAVGAFQVYASLTRIDTKHMFELTGSGINNMPGDAGVRP